MTIETPQNIFSDSFATAKKFLLMDLLVHAIYSEFELLGWYLSFIQIYTKKRLGHIPLDFFHKDVQDIIPIFVK